MNMLDDEGIQIIADAVNANNTRIPLAKLYLSDNDVSLIALINLASKRVRFPGLFVLDFSQNEEVSYQYQR